MFLKIRHRTPICNLFQLNLLLEGIPIIGVIQELSLGVHHLVMVVAVMVRSIGQYVSNLVIGAILAPSITLKRQMASISTYKNRYSFQIPTIEIFSMLLVMRD